MLTKVSYNAYTSSANGITKQNQPKNVNFGMIGFGNTKLFEEFGRKFIPVNLINHRMTMMDTNFECARLEVAVDFLKACKKCADSGVTSIRAALAGLPLGHDNSSLETLDNRAILLKELVEFLKQHSRLSTGDMISGVNKVVPFETLENELTRMRSSVK